MSGPSLIAGAASSFASDVRPKLLETVTRTAIVGAHGHQSDAQTWAGIWEEHVHQP